MPNDIDASMASALDILNADPSLSDEFEGEDTEVSQQEAGESGADDTPTDQEGKPNEPEKVEPEKALEPPSSWRSDEKELFKNLPSEQQEILLRLQQASDSHFTQRSTELAQKIRSTDDERQQYQSDRARYAAELGRIEQMAAQLLPAKFSDIQSHADYLRLKATDPARASEFEAFQMTLQSVTQQQEQLRQQAMNERLNHEWAQLCDKYPEFKDTAKAVPMLDAVRKTACEHYGFSPEEVRVIGDHRYIPIIQDAMAWRQHQTNLKAAQSKRAVPAPTKVLPNASTNGQGAMANDRKAALLNRARGMTDDYRRAELLASLI